MRAATHEKHVQEPVPVDVSNPRVDVSDLRAPMFPALRRKTTVQILILILILGRPALGLGVRHSVSVPHFPLQKSLHFWPHAVYANEVVALGACRRKLLRYRCGGRLRVLR